jgi:protoporphyrinogen oxidase
MNHTRMPAPAKKIVILGAGPTGIGAAWRLRELGHDDWRLFEAAECAGGLASSFTDPAGFTWDVGGHVQFSHYDYFDAAMDAAHPAADWIHHQRESWIWMRRRFIPYPLQYNIGLLPPEERDACLRGLEAIAAAAAAGSPHWSNFAEWIDATFGAGLRRVFMEPYNRKVWAWPLDRLDAGWVGDRVAVPNLDRIRKNIASGELDRSWGPNNQFRFPLRGGTGSIWLSLAAQLAEQVPGDRLAFNTPATRIDPDRRVVTFAGGREEPYDVLISSIALDRLLEMAGLGEAETTAARFVSSASNIVGVGLEGAPPESIGSKCWIYFPENDNPFYRVTVFSNYSPNNVPRAGTWSLMAEVAESPHKPVDQTTLVESVIDGLLATGLIRRDDKILSTWRYRAAPGYPTPFLNREQVVDTALRDLQSRSIYSRGRFGAWKYEVSNQDHSFMQGVEAVDHALEEREELTVWKPDLVNTERVR